VQTAATGLGQIPRSTERILVQNKTHADELDSFDEFVVAVEYQHRCKLPLFRLAMCEEFRELVTVALVDVLESSEVCHHHLHFDQSFIDLPFEHLVRIKVTSTLA